MDTPRFLGLSVAGSVRLASSKLLRLRSVRPADLRRRGDTRGKDIVPGVGVTGCRCVGVGVGDGVVEGRSDDRGGSICLHAT